MTAVLIPTSSEAEWLEARRQGITASEIAVVLGLSPYSSPYKLYHQKLGILPPDDDNPAMERGRVLEPYVVEKFAAAHPEFLVEGDGRQLYAHAGRPWQLATPDRDLFAAEDPDDPLIWDFAGLLETKTASDMSGWGEPGTDEIPVHYRAQVLWQMDVRGAWRVFVACLDVPRWEVREYVIEHDPYVRLGYDVTHTIDDTGSICGLCGDILMMRTAALEFLDRIERREEPDVDHRPATLDALKALHPSMEDRHVVVPARLAARYRAACKALKKAEQRKALTENLIRARLGNGQAAYDGATAQLLATRQVYDVPAKTVERKAFTVDKLMPAKPKEVKTS